MRAPASLAFLAGAALAWGWFEAGWVRFRKLDVPISGMPHEFDGLRIVHLSDFHLGPPSPGTKAVQRAVAWTQELDPDLVLVSGDLLTRPNGEARLRELMARLPRCYAILGNHDFAISRDPGARRTQIEDLEPATLLADEGTTIDLRGRTIYIAGSDPRARFAQSRTSASELAVASTEADLRILIVHYPELAAELPAGAFDLVVAGHMHDGQICLPLSPGRKIRLAHPSARYTSGIYRLPGGVLHVSPGLGTTFVPFRFAARPEATELTLRSAP